MSAADIACVPIVLVAGAAGVLLTAMSLPGTWFILLTASAAAWIRSESGLIGGTTLVILAGLAVLGEAIELLAGAMGAKRAGASFLGAAGAMVGGVAGGIAGTIFIPVFIVGSVLGAAAGAFAGALCGEALAGRSVEASVASGRGAFFGRLLGTVSKLGVAAAMWIALALACFL